MHYNGSEVNLQQQKIQKCFAYFGPWVAFGFGKKILNWIQVGSPPSQKYWYVKRVKH